MLINAFFLAWNMSDTNYIVAVDRPRLMNSNERKKNADHQRWAALE
jgi:hypothetical protein